MKNYAINLKRCMSFSFKGFIAVLLLLAFNFKVSAGFNLPDEKIQLKIENGTIKEALREIERQCQFTFIYNDANVNVNQHISVSCSDKSLSDLLDEILIDRGIKYTFVDNHIVLTNAMLQQQSRTITGTVTDAATGDALPGVTVLEKGTNHGVVTDIDGKFSIDVNDASTLVISYVGYKAQEIPVAGQTEISIGLELEVVSLSEVVVIGYGTMKKSDLTGAVASVSSEDIRQNIGSGIDQALQGRTAGVSVTTNSGAPGVSPTVRIRGMGTITNPNPFFVVDGMPISAESVGSLNPGDIESMEVLKDASAAAIYGARAANGVVLITTKRAKEGRSSINLDAYFGRQSVAKKYDIMNGTEWTSIRNASGQPRVDSSKVVNTDWQDEVFRKANVSSYQLSFLNGTEKTNYAVVGSYFNQEGIVKGSDYNRFTIRLNSISTIKKWLVLGENIGLSHSKQNLIPEQDEWSSVIVQALNMDPTTPVYDTAGNPMGSLHNNVTNPVGLIERNHNVMKTDQLLGNIYLEIKPFPWMTFRSSVGTEINRYENVQFFPIYYESPSLNSTETKLLNGWFKKNSMLFEQLLTLKKTFYEKHDIQLLLGYTRQQNSYRLDIRQTSQVPESEDMWFISNGNAEAIQYEDVQSLLNIPSQSNLGSIPYDASMISYLARLIYSFGNRYDVTASIRRDGSSKFGPEKQWGNFPSFAVGWKITEEPFFPKNEYVNFIKLRAGWGQLGNQEIGDYSAYTSVNYGYNYTYGWYPTQATAYGGAPVRFSNKAVQWETTEQTNIGLDATFFRTSLSINFDYFIRNTKDMLAQTPVPGITGIEIAPFVNTGTVLNKGYELNASYHGNASKLNYTIGFNLGHVKNEVTKLGSEQPVGSAPFRASDNISRTEVGQPIAYFYGFKTDGIYKTQADIDALNAKAQEATGKASATYDSKVKPGDVKMVDMDGDFQITAKDKTLIGSPHPKLTYGVNIDLDYGPVDLKIFGQGVYGNQVFMSTIYYLESGDAYWNLLSDMKNYWQKEGDDTDIPRLGSYPYNLRLSDRYVFSGSYFRIKTIQLGFTIPASIVQKIGIERCRIYYNGQNLISIHNYPGFDPEIGVGKNQGTTINQRGFLDIGIDRGMYPLAKTHSIGINLTF
jgi:TonB-dependent starch-binding outer membrane protein SusC